jgi:hypothetical protein
MHMSMPAGVDNATLARVKAFWRWCIQHVEVQQGHVACEVRVVHPELALAGTIDCITTNYDGVPTILDWKTNDELSSTGYSNMLPPFQRGKLALSDSNLSTYFLQLNIYRRILIDRYGFDDDLGMVIVHLRHDGTFEEYPVTLMEDHVEKIISPRRKPDVDRPESPA